VGATSDENQLDSSLPKEDFARDLRNLRCLRDHYADQVRALYPKAPGEFPANNSISCCPKMSLTWRDSRCGTEGTCVIVPKPKLRMIRAPQLRTSGGRLRGYIYCGRSRFPKFCLSGPSSSKDLKKPCRRTQKENAPHLELIPEGRGILPLLNLDPTILVRRMNRARDCSIS